MLVPSRRPRLLLLLLLLLLLALSARSASGEDVAVSKVFSDHVEVTWNKTGDWYDVDNFKVTINTPVTSCTENEYCAGQICKFNSLICGSLEACSSNDVTVSGNNTSSGPVSFQTAPEPVTGLQVQVVEGVLLISWTNPPIQSSSCYTDTAVQVDNGGIASDTTFHPHTEESHAVPLCETTGGRVNVWTRGGDGGSAETSRSYYYYLHSPVTNLSCQPEGCYGIELTWDYNPVCPNVTHFCVEVDVAEADCTEDTATTSFLVTGLEEDTRYFFSIYTYGKDGKISNPESIYCRTHDTAVRNLVAVSTSPDSLSATWEPPVCPSAESLVYEVHIDTYSCLSDPQDTTIETSYAWSNLEAFKEYYVCVSAEGNKMESKRIYTQPRRLAWLRLEMAGNDTVLVVWEMIWEYELYDHYIVTWANETRLTDYPRYTIKGYSSTEELGLLCVAVFMEPYSGMNGTGPTRCSNDPGQEPKERDPPDVLLIVLVSTSVVSVTVAVVAIAVNYWMKKKEKVEPATRNDIE